MPSTPSRGRMHAKGRESDNSPGALAGVRTDTDFALRSQLKRGASRAVAGKLCGEARSTNYGSIVGTFWCWPECSRPALSKRRLGTGSGFVRSVRTAVTYSRDCLSCRSTLPAAVCYPEALCRFHASRSFPRIPPGRHSHRAVQGEPVCIFGKTPSPFTFSFPCVFISFEAIGQTW